MNRNYLCVYDFETGGKLARKSQPIQLAAIIIDPKKLCVVKGGEFESLMKPFSDEECDSYGLEPIQDEALVVNKKTREQIKSAPELKDVWAKFIDWLHSFNIGTNDWGLPIQCGYNINNFDKVIIERLAAGHNLGIKEPYKFGPSDQYGAKVFHPIHSIDIMNVLFNFSEGVYNPKMNSLSMDNMREYTGMISEHAHDARQDVYDTGELLIRCINLNRKFGKKINFEGRCKERVLKKL